MTNLAKHVGNKMMYFRKKQKLSQEQLADLMGINDRSYVSSLEHGYRNVRIDTIEKIARALQVEVVELFTELPKMKLKKTGIYGEW